MNNQDEAVFRAAEIKLEIAKLTSEYELMKKQVIDRVKELSEGKDKYALQVGELGKFLITKFRKWNYSQAIQDTESLLTESKKREEADGTAKFTESEVLKFNELKHEE